VSRVLLLFLQFVLKVRKLPYLTEFAYQIYIWVQQVRSGVSARVPLGTIPGVDEERFLNSKQLLGPRHRLRRVRRSICPPGSHPFVTESAALAPAPAREASCLRRWAVDGDFFCLLSFPHARSLSLFFFPVICLAGCCLAWNINAKKTWLLVVNCHCSSLNNHVLIQLSYVETIITC
jgi:hypothetical protein